MKKLYLKQTLSKSLDSMEKVYVVTQVVNSITPKINEELEPVAVKNYCDLAAWQVIIK